MMNLSLSTTASLVLALSLLGGTAVSRSLFPSDQAQTESTAQEGEKKGEHDDEQGEHEEHSVLHESMESMQASLKALRKMLGKPEQKAEAIDLCVKMEGAALTGFMHAPESPDGLEGSELHAYQAEFKKRMLSVASTLVDLELALEREDADAAKELYRVLGADKKEGHSLYIK